MEKLITGYEYELVADYHNFGSGRYGLKIKLVDDISQILPYLNTILDDTWYDSENQVLIGAHIKQRYAFRPNEIQITSVNDASRITHQIDEVINLINKTWEARDHIEPSISERKTPAVYDIFKLLPKHNCKEYNYPTCLAFAAELCKDVALLGKCPPLSQTENDEARRHIVSLFSFD